MPQPIFELHTGGNPRETSNGKNLLWVQARSQEVVLKAIEGTGATFLGQILVSAGIDFRLPRQTHALRDAISQTFTLI